MLDTNSLMTPGARNLTPLDLTRGMSLVNATLPSPADFFSRTKYVESNGSEPAVANRIDWAEYTACNKQLHQCFRLAMKHIYTLRRPPQNVYTSKMLLGISSSVGKNGDSSTDATVALIAAGSSTQAAAPAHRLQM